MSRSAWCVFPVLAAATAAAGQVADFQAGRIGIADLLAGFAAAPHFTTHTPQ
jgi:hypothetical protein